MEFFKTLNKEKIIFSLLVISFFVGIWSSFPMTSSIFDEMFAGGILRSIENHSILPQGQEIPYGTLTYFLSYPIMVVFLAILIPFMGFEISALKLFLVNNSYVIYLVPRLLSIVCTIFLLYFINRFLKKVIKEEDSRLFILVLLFTNILVTIIFHTAKVWPLSLFLIILSFIFLCEVVVLDEQENRNRKILLSVLFSFLAFANFPIAGFSLINIPIIYYFTRKKKESVPVLIRSCLLGIFIFCIVTLLNFNGITAQIKSIVFDYTLSDFAIEHNVSLVDSFIINTKRVLMCYPLFILALILLLIERARIMEKRLLYLSSFYLILYLTIISVVARWAIDPYPYIRYVIPISFFFSFVLASFEIKIDWKFKTLSVVSIIYWLFVLYYLSVPTTYIEALNYVSSNLNRSGVVVFNKASQEFDLQKNREAYAISDDSMCGSKCKYIMNSNIRSEIKYILINSQTKSEFSNSALYDGKEVYSIYNETQIDPNMVLVRSFINNTVDKQRFFIDLIGSYFEPEFFNMGRFGKNLYIYKAI